MNCEWTMYLGIGLILIGLGLIVIGIGITILREALD